MSWVEVSYENETTLLVGGYYDEEWWGREIDLTVEDGRHLALLVAWAIRDKQPDEADSIERAVKEAETCSAASSASGDIYLTTTAEPAP